MAAESPAAERPSPTESPLASGDVRALFTELVAGALEERSARVSPLARGYLVDLLLEQLQAEGSEDAPHHAWALAERLARVREKPGLERIPRLRGVGDRALFVAGFFRASLARRHAEPRVRYEQVGRAAYADVARCLARRVAEPTWSGLFAELAERFELFEDLLAEVSVWSRPDPQTDLLRTVDRYVRTGNPHDRERLLQAGMALPSRRDPARC